MIYNKHFNPRAPQGARQDGIIVRYDRKEFQSTRSAGSATAQERRRSHDWEISIHALRRERDIRVDDVMKTNAISIHALRRERDFGLDDALHFEFISIHALRRERDVHTR